MAASVAAMDALARRPWLAPLGLALIAQALFSFRLGTPHIFVFDEVHYVPAARKMLELAGPANVEHPLFGKVLIALGIGLAGDNPVGWRLLSTFAGTATVLAVWAIVRLLTGRERSALLAGLIAITGQTIFVQARIAMLDTFMAALLAGGLALLLWALKSVRWRWAKWLGGAALIGLAIGTKWAALPYLGFAGLGLIVLRWRRPRDPGLPTLPALIALGIVAIIAYVATFVPATLYANEPLNILKLAQYHANMFALQTQVLPHHTYQSNWWTWPLMIRPIWYLYEPVDGVQRGIWLIANPVVAWGGLIAVGYCLWRGLRMRSLTLFAAGGLWLASVAMWAAIPKSLGFYYYYYPSTIWLAIALGVAWDKIDPDGVKRWDEWYATFCIGVFAYFWPVLSAAPLNGPGAFHRWTWFDSWI